MDGKKCANREGCVIMVVRWTRVRGYRGIFVKKIRREMASSSCECRVGSAGGVDVYRQNGEGEKKKEFVRSLGW